MMISGLTLANVLCVLFGTFLGQAGGWRVTFAAVAVAGVFAWAALALWLPADRGRPADLRADLQALLAPQVVLVLPISVVTAASMFTFFTFVAQLLTAVCVSNPASQAPLKKPPRAMDPSSSAPASSRGSRRPGARRLAPRRSENGKVLPADTASTVGGHRR